ncbi:MAG: 6-phosphogluconolactonase [Tetrasphaera jenkinsii]|jgi:6-phosphogluconolactonase|uniref:6-phosphogluconolactonase n=1 Tax=Nostocoides jenkinsii Ben 74 TaxID=1193518 RepID=A0A077MB40_9MICO|nr:6-phosphogluconolactonase [Tetrasphaera jenkinsii]MCI1261746.1 6-phosphogluconolactonase [Tetrasphaera jenkinsii]CCI54571.1 6-phosphogluconolactonase [Tetrasphaera jenkinsii Ben 74]
MTAPARLLIHPDKRSLAAAAAARLITAIVDTLAVKPEAQLALTGGSMGSDVWRAVAASPARGAVDWSRVRVWWGDERYLPAGDPDRNDTQNDAAGLAELGLVPDNVHRVAGPDTSESAEASAAAYAETIRTFGQHEWDVVLFGVGPDGHIASLFPGHPAQLTTGEIAIAVHDSPKPPPTRVSLTFECVDRAQRVWFLVAGEDKRQAVVDGLAGAGPSVSSAAQVHGVSETLWLVDAAAAGDH